MKRVLIFLALCSTIGIVINSCKKGADDPFFSLRSRDTRLVGIWKISGIQWKTYTITTNSSLSSIPDTILKTITQYPATPFLHPNIGSDSLKETTTLFSTPDSIYYEKLYINSDGTFTDSISSRLYSPSNKDTKKNTRIITDTWFWLNGKKNKDGLMLNGTLYKNYSIDRLSWKQLVLKYYKKTVTNPWGETATQVIDEGTLTYSRVQ